MIYISKITAINMSLVFPIEMPKKPKWFLCEEKDMEFTESNIKKLAKEYNLAYTLDYLKATVEFTQKIEEL
jgi:hypothetical protein